MGADDMPLDWRDCAHSGSRFIDLVLPIARNSLATLRSVVDGHKTDERPTHPAMADAATTDNAWSHGTV